MDADTRIMSGVATKNNSWIIPAEPRARNTRSRSSGTVILTHSYTLRPAAGGRRRR
jgi:hypothetical protein